MKIKDLGGGNYQTYPITDDMIEVDDIDKWVEEHTPNHVKADRRVFELRCKLADTDYIVSKIAEAQVFAQDQMSALKEKYSEIISQREQWRAEINQLQEQYGLE